MTISVLCGKYIQFLMSKYLLRLDRKNAPKSAPKVTFWFMKKVLGSVSGKHISECWIIFVIWGSIWPFFYYRINHTRNDIIGHPPPSPTVKQYVNYMYTKHVYQQLLSKDYVVVGFKICFKGGQCGSLTRVGYYNIPLRFHFKALGDDPCQQG